MSYSPTEELYDRLERVRMLLVRAQEVRGAMHGPPSLPSASAASGTEPPSRELSPIDRFLRENVEPGFVPRSPELESALAAIDAHVTRRTESRETPFVRLATLLGLDELERDLLLAAVAPAVRRGFRETLQLLGPELGPGLHPAAHLVELCASSSESYAHARAALDSDGRLVASGALDADRPSPLVPPLWAAIAPSQTTLRWLSGLPSSAPLLETEPPLRRLTDAQLLAELESAVEAAAQRDQPARLVLVGEPGTGRTRAAAALATGLGLEAQRVAVPRRDGPPAAAAGLDAATRAALLDARLRRRMVFVAAAAQPLDPAFVDALARLDVPVAVSVDAGSAAEAALLGAGFVRLAVQPPSQATQREAWRAALAVADTDALGELVRSHSLGLGAIEAAAVEARAAAASSRSGKSDTRALLAAAEKAARSAVSHRLSEIADRLSTTLTWDDLILPDDVRAAVDEVWRAAAARHTVFDQWGMGARTPYGRSVSAMFTGDPGTGKTMVATLVARQLGLELYRVDLSRLVDKYIGETEKHLATLFAEAERGRCVILFDEADAIFGKRTSKGESSQERYANLEVNYLLQRIETFSGICILTTNQEQIIDTAFRRRIRYRVDFPFPGVDERALLWARMLPPEAPFADDVDPEELARRYEMSGGHIKSAVLRACFAAASSGRPIDQDCLLHAADQELEHMGKLVKN